MELYQKTAAELSSLIHAGEVSASEVCRAVLARTHEVDSKVGAYVTLMARSCRRWRACPWRSRTTSAPRVP